jgi:hypothetical protein
MRVSGQDLATANTTLSNHDQSLTNLDTLMVRALASVPSTTAVAASTRPRTVKLAEPSKFDGSDKNKAISFRVAVAHYLHISFPQATVDEQIAYIISCLDGKAHEWLEPYLEQDIVQGNIVPWLHDLTGFWTQFNARWNVSNKTENFRVKLKSLKQTKSVQEFFKDFQMYSQNLGYNDISLRDHFYDGLSVKIKEFLMAQGFDHADPNVSLQNLADKALQIDQRLEAFQAQNKTSSSSSSTQQHTSGPKSTSSPSAASPTGTARGKMSVGEKVYLQGPDGKARKGEITSIVRNTQGQSIPTVKWNDGKTEAASFREIKRDGHPVATVTTSATGPTPMDIDAAGKGKKPIVCNNCGGKGHYANACPSRPFSGQGAEILESESENEDI